MATRKRKTDDTRFGEETVVTDYFRAGSPAAREALGGDFKDVDCVRCGSKISHVFMTNYGPMGGDCVATLTGDDSMRKDVRRVAEALKQSKFSVEFYKGRLNAVEVEFKSAPGARPAMVVSTRATFWNDLGYAQTKSRYIVSAKPTPAAFAAAVQWAEENGLEVEVKGEPPWKKQQSESARPNPTAAPDLVSPLGIYYHGTESPDDLVRFQTFNASEAHGSGLYGGGLYLHADQTRARSDGPMVVSVIVKPTARFLVATDTVSRPVLSSQRMAEIRTDWVERSYSWRKGAKSKEELAARFDEMFLPDARDFDRRGWYAMIGSWARSTRSVDGVLFGDVLVLTNPEAVDSIQFRQAKGRAAKFLKCAPEVDFVAERIVEGSAKDLRYDKIGMPAFAMGPDETGCEGTAYGVHVGNAEDWLPVLGRDQYIFGPACIYEIDFAAYNERHGATFFHHPDPHPIVKDEVPWSAIVFSHLKKIPAEAIRLVREVSAGEIASAVTEYEREHPMPNPTRQKSKTRIHPLAESYKLFTREPLVDKWPGIATIAEYGQDEWMVSVAVAMETLMAIPAEQGDKNLTSRRAVAYAIEQVIPYDEWNDNAKAVLDYFAGRKPELLRLRFPRDITIDVPVIHAVGDVRVHRQADPKWNEQTKANEPGFTKKYTISAKNGLLFLDNFRKKDHAIAVANFMMEPTQRKLWDWWLNEGDVESERRLRNMIGELAWMPEEERSRTAYGDVWDVPKFR